MKIVGVRHKPEHENIFWFKVPDDIAPVTKLGAKVICNTSKGKSTGKIVMMVEGIESEGAVSDLTDGHELKNIISVETNYKLEDISIPYAMELSSPNPGKIAGRVKEFYKSGRFNTPVNFDSDGTLTDGYTAYLVAKMFGHETLHGFCMSK